MSMPAEKIEKIIKEGKKIEVDVIDDFFNNFHPVIEEDFQTVGDSVSEVLMGRCPGGTRPGPQ